MMWHDHEFSCWIAFERAGVAAGYKGPSEHAARWVAMVGDAPCTCTPVTPSNMWSVRKMDFPWYLRRTKFDRAAGFELDRFRSASDDYTGILERIRALLADVDAGAREPIAVLELIRQLEKDAA